MAKNTSDGMSPKDRSLIGTIARAFRQGAVERCLAGNDTGCFTVEQYKAAYDAVTNEGLPPDAARWSTNWTHGLPETHLRSMPDLVREVRPGVWAAK